MAAPSMAYTAGGAVPGFSGGRAGPAYVGHAHTHTHTDAAHGHAVSDGAYPGTHSTAGGGPLRGGRGGRGGGGHRGGGRGGHAADAHAHTHAHTDAHTHTRSDGDRHGHMHGHAGGRGGARGSARGGGHDAHHRPVSAAPAGEGGTPPAKAGSKRPRRRNTRGGHAEAGRGGADAAEAAGAAGADARHADSEASEGAAVKKRSHADGSRVVAREHTHVAAHAHRAHDDGDGAVAAEAPAMNAAFLSDMRFDDPSIVSKMPALIARALGPEGFRFTLMSKVQASTLPLILNGADVFAKAKTGSGKTLAFLIPVFTRLFREPHAPRRPGVGALVISPTRELALQILAEAHALAKFAPHIQALAVIGGRNISTERNALMRGGRTVSVDVLVATPGRLVDHMESTPGFIEALGAARVLVLDEADRLLDMGFKPQLDRIIAALPPNTATSASGRQNLLFSATVPKDVLDICGRVLRPSYQLVDCVGAEDVDTHAHVHQEVLVVPNASVMPALARILQHATRDRKHKIIVFFPTARATGFAAGLFGLSHWRMNIVKIHSRKSQSARNAASERFRRESGIIMFTSDVSARGMDYADVSLVIQVGLTDHEQYVHRLGRTARAGREGAGLLLLADFEVPLLTELNDLPLHLAGADSELTGGAAAGLPGHGLKTVPLGKPAVAAAVPPSPEWERALATVAASGELSREASQAYGAWLGFYNSNLRRVRWNKERLVAEANALFLTLGLTEVPMMPRDTLGKMGLRGTPGLREGPKGWKPGH